MKHSSQFGSTQTIESAPEPVVFVKSLEYPAGLEFRGVVPSHINRDPSKIRLPTLPEVRVSSLRIIQPCILFVQFSCPERCRSYGICTHYQFVLGCRRCPDGLLCDCCHDASMEDAIIVDRVCPLHQDPARPKPISSRPEDFLASQAQKQAAHEILRRSTQNDWDDLKDAGQNGVSDKETSSRTQRDRTP